MALTPMLAGTAAVARARQYTRYTHGMCLNFVSNVLTGGRMLQYYGVTSNVSYALQAYRAAKHVHTDRKPPAGVPVYFTAGANGYGHIAISVGGGRIRSTDWPYSTRRGTLAPVGECTIEELERKWGRKYLGWSEDFYGIYLPGFPRVAPRVLVPYPGHPHSDNRKDDKHVEQIQKRLKQLGKYTGKIDGSFGPKTKAAVIAFQRDQKVTRDGVVGPVTWRRLRIYNR